MYPFSTIAALTDTINRLKEKNDKLEDANTKLRNELSAIRDKNEYNTYPIYNLREDKDCPACLVGNMRAKHYTNSTIEHPILLLTCSNCGYTMKRKPLYAATKES